ncbi:lipoate--protein ligase [Duganella sp. FT92W]|uniref:Lipoate--protein ligase n=1 Tax=Pseudoduganella rivuli TaxID=2666085 RepID=A0A7X2LSR5_9BURK|nr:lipoate--protein ligase [Pseudoduganella rivuli]MRV71177.1 lipoate--protein ligase [Pseudoduganella rivuli]
MFTPLWSMDGGPAPAACEEEQAWNERRLAEPVTSPALRLWTYRVPGVVLGCAQRRLYELGPALPADGSAITVIPRMAGGGAVLTGPWMLSASVLLPYGHPLLSSSLVDSYRWLGEVFASVLRGQGFTCHAATPAEAARLQEQRGSDDLDWACYGGYSPWEVVAGGRKLVGLAQVRRRTGVLLAAGLLLDQPDWLLLTGAMGRPAAHAARLAACNTSCTQLRGAGNWKDAIAGPLLRALEYALFQLPEDMAGQELALY